MNRPILEPERPNIFILRLPWLQSQVSKLGSLLGHLSIFYIFSTVDEFIYCYSNFNSPKVHLL